jgi:hypothetical protein
MRTWIVGLAVAAALVATPRGEAARWDFRPGLQGQGQRPQDANQKQGGRTIRDARRGVPPSPERPSGRLTEEERRELRRDVDRANREIYRRSK